MHMDASAYSFIMQMCVAEAMILAGRASHALLVQSSAPSRCVDYDDGQSPIIGDGATAVVMAPASGERGIVASVHNVDGRFARTLVASVPGKRWFDEGRAVIHVADPQQMKEVFLLTIDACKSSVESVLAKAGWSPDQVDYLSMFQGTPWLRELVQESLQLRRARSVDAFSRTGYLASALIPATLALGEQAGALHDDDLVVLTGGGTGMTFGAVALRWGK
ncbi:MAG: 3-oxoacyl-[acyl-carrier-protein] synthase III C-terminal domain-containing protein [Kofleriaceae bacterium]